MRLLILTVSAGNGHSKAAEAIEDCLNRYHSNVEVQIIDTLKYINPVVDKLVVGSYLKTLRKTPFIYAKLYKYAETEDAISTFSGLVNDVLSLKLKGLIDEFNPDVILCTHPFPLEMLSILKRKGKTTVPVAAVLTDYAPHSFWFYSYIDAYVIPHEDFVTDLIEKGISKEAIYPLGIPVNQDFLNPIEVDNVYNEFDLDKNKLTLLLMGGSLGIGNIKDIFENLAFSSLNVQLIACTGSNTKLKNQLDNISSRCNKKTVILGFTNKINELMSVSDIIISKPGGLTITEALIKHLPFIIISPIPGQEERNADYLLNSGIAARIKNSENIVPLLNQLTSSPNRLNQMRQSAAEKSKPDAAKDICNLLIRLANNKNI